MMPELLRSEIRTARKPHTCSLCGEEIKTGEQYGYDTYKFNGEVYDWKTHMECDAVSSLLWDYVDPDDGMTSDDFLDASCIVWALRARALRNIAEVALKGQPFHRRPPLVSSESPTTE